jgi:hypothetical protein
MAKEADLWITSDERIAAVVRFANLVAAAERSACAQVCDLAIQANTYQGNNWTLSSCAKAIRARGEK